jgi:hypothetical protein
MILCCYVCITVDETKEILFNNNQKFSYLWKMFGLILELMKTFKI